MNVFTKFTHLNNTAPMIFGRSGPLFHKQR